jgi:hypothetical protein
MSDHNYESWVHFWSVLTPLNLLPSFLHLTQVQVVLSVCNSTSFSWAVSQSFWTSCNSKMAVFWDVTPSSLVEVFRRFRGACCHQHENDTETVSTSETSVNFYQTTRRNIPEDSHLQMHKSFKNPLIEKEENRMRKNNGRMKGLVRRWVKSTSRLVNRRMWRWK